MEQSQNQVNYTCPYCQKQQVQTTTKVASVRGYILAFQLRRRRYLGCVPCVRKKVLKEVGRSLLLGWFSIIALILNPFLIIYMIFQAILVRTNIKKVHRVLQKAGVPTDPSYIRVTSLSYGLASAMITADGKIEAQEVTQANEIGKQLFHDFDEDEFYKIVHDYKNLPSADTLAGIIKDGLDNASKSMIYKYLHAIAHADGTVAEEESELLERIAQKMDYIPENA